MRLMNQDVKLILVTAITPPAGEGKTTTSGLNDGK